jgi:NTP pyrophosphatase (non-canonical NTP hydrolase)
MFEEKINEIFGRVNKEIQNLKTDSSKTLSIFAELLTEIAQELAELKRDTVALKTSYEIGFITKKDEREEQIRLLLSK